MITRSTYSFLPLILLSGLLALYGNSLDGMGNWLSSARIGLGTCSIPFLKNRVAVNCSLELASRSMTVNDVCRLIANKFIDIGQDIEIMGVIVRQLWAALSMYVVEKPANAAIIGSGLTLAIVAARYLLYQVTDLNKCRNCELMRRRVSSVVRHV